MPDALERASPGSFAPSAVRAETNEEPLEVDERGAAPQVVARGGRPASSRLDGQKESTRHIRQRSPSRRLLALRDEGDVLVRAAAFRVATDRMPGGEAT